MKNEPMWPSEEGPNDGPIPWDMETGAKGPLSPVECQRYADDLWMDSLLREVNRPAGEMNRDVERGLSAWKESAERPVSTASSGPAIPQGHEAGRRSWLVSTLSISAAVASVFALWSFSSGAMPTAQAAVEQARVRANDPVDRQYHIQCELPNLPDVHAELYLRGTDRFTLKVQGPLDSTHWLGTTRERSWFVPGAGPVIVAKDLQPVLERVSEAFRLPATSLRIGDVLRSLEKDYVLELGKGEMIPAFGSTPARRVVASKRSGFRPLLPMKVTFWSHPDTGVVGRLILDWTGQLETVAVRRLSFELKSQQPKEDGWYDHTSHHEADRPVVRLEPRPASEPETK